MANHAKPKIAMNTHINGLTEWKNAGGNGARACNKAFGESVYRGSAFDRSYCGVISTETSTVAPDSLLARATNLRERQLQTTAGRRHLSIL